MIKEASDFFQNTKFYSILNIHNSADCQFFKFVWIANSMLSCTVSYQRLKKNLPTAKKKTYQRLKIRNQFPVSS